MIVMMKGRNLATNTMGNVSVSRTYQEVNVIPAEMVSMVLSQVAKVPILSSFTDIKPINLSTFKSVNAILKELNRVTSKMGRVNVKKVCQVTTVTVSTNTIFHH